MISVDVIFILLAIALCVLAGYLLSRLKSWVNELDNIISILRNIFEDKEN